MMSYIIQDITDVSCVAQTNLQKGLTHWFIYHNQKATIEARAGSELEM